ncbi:hypothetical protein [Zhongshania sp.]|uniref:hypothetical protein n=1 Tax=Zhongshania sp. TaxID=1971902 RepID=UPI00356662CF
MTAKVFVTQEAHRYNYAPAEAFGEVHFITQKEMSTVGNSRINEQIALDIKRFLAGYIPGTDYLITSGNPITGAQIMMSLGRKFGDCEHNMLKWDSASRQYLNHKVRPCDAN